MKTRKPVTVAVSILCLTTLTISAIAQAKQPVPVPATPKEMKYTGLRAMQYCEVWLFVPQPNKMVFVDYYNTTGFNDKANKKDSCPTGMWAKVNPEQTKDKYEGVANVFKNGPRGWTMDWATIPVGDAVGFDGLIRAGGERVNCRPR
jgi:hypothetical protein